MAGGYYFLVAGLPDIEFENGRDAPHFHAFADELEPELTRDDACLLHFIRLETDLFNLIALTEKSDPPFEEGGNFSSHALKEALGDPGMLPPCLARFVEARQEKAPLYRNMSWEEQAIRLYRTEAERLPNRFLRDWYEFDGNLVNLQTALRCRAGQVPLERRRAERLEGSNSQMLIGRSEVVRSILWSNAPDFDIAPLFPEVDQVLALEGGDTTARERGIDRLRWNWLAERSRFHAFDVEFLLAYCLKLRILGRWQRLKADKGRERLEGILAGMESACRFEEGAAQRAGS